MSWASKYISIPFKEKGCSFDGCDCWGLVRLIYTHEKSIVLPVLVNEYVNTNDFQSISKLHIRERNNSCWIKTDSPQEFDVVSLRLKSHPWHVGIMKNTTEMLHVMQGMNVVSEPVFSFIWKNRIEGFYKWILSQSTPV